MKIIKKTMKNYKFKKGISKTFVFVIIGVVIILTWFYFLQGENKIPIESDYGSKIVYTTDQEVDVSKLREHCQEQGGVFNECGDVCSPHAEICSSVCAYTCEQISEKDQVDTSEWEDFKNEQFNFSLRYPANDWNMYNGDSNELFPAFNFYIKPAGVPLDLPLNHFANFNHVSVYPEGIPTEGVFGQTKDFGLDLGIEVEEESKLYLLEDGTPFAAFIKPDNPPQSWNENGFVWMRLEINNLNVRCLRDGEEIDSDDCDPMAEDDQIMRSGSVNEELWEIQKEVVKSFVFTEEKLISVASPEAGEVISSPLEVEGEARGQWYFEAEFHVVLVDWDGRIIAETNARAQDDWMTEDFVPFKATIDFESPYQEGDPDFMKEGTLILQKANPSGLPEHEDAFEIPVRFE